ncbi:transcriptional regulator [Nocardia sputorum]|uniref:helix-turn-helix domain-containing protein n=1 Tax=Nocardia sputorum TaxID=2984338 RepID=UPI002492F02C|nr:helix-turn-helix transcriptional regulator [Nocardia sputorum]BDT93870.1 transcriptional regulator [Nocardia sputorum]
MNLPGEEDASTLPRRQLGRFLRETREGQGLTIDQAAKLAELSKSGLHRIETAQVAKIKIREVKALCEVYGVDPTDTRRAVELAEQAQVKGWYTAFGGLFTDTFNMYVGLEASARRLVIYHEQIPGLLQTASYARAVISAFYADDALEHIDRRVELRMKRQKIVTRKSHPLELEVLLHESALHRVIGCPRVMAAQLRHLAEMSKLPNVTVRVHPYTAGMVWGILHGQFVVLDFGVDHRGRPAEPPIVFLEGGPSADVYLEKADEVRKYYELAAAIRTSSLDETRSRDLLRRVARSYEA